MATFKANQIIICILISFTIMFMIAVHFLYDEFTITVHQLSELTASASTRADNQTAINYRTYGSSLIFGPIFWDHLPNQTQQLFKTYFPMNAIVNIDERFKGVLNLHNVAPLYHDHISLIPETHTIIWHAHGIKVMMECVRLKYQCVNISELSNYKNAALQLYSIFDELESDLSWMKHVRHSLNVLVGGSISPWVESIVLGLNISEYVTTTDYQLPRSEYEYIKTVNIMDLKNNPKHKAQYDVIITYSSIEHDGLGRYGDPLNPFGDFAAMQEFHYMLRCMDDVPSFLILNVPFGKSGILYFNQHRQYGRVRIAELIQQTQFEWIGYTLQDRPAPLIKFEALNISNITDKAQYFWEDYTQTNRRTRGDNTLVLRPQC